MSSPRSCETVIHHPLMRALVTVREHAQTMKNPNSFRIASLFEDLPQRLEAARRGEETYEEVLATFSDRAKSVGLETWLESNSRFRRIEASTQSLKPDRDLLYDWLSLSFIEIRGNASTQPTS